MVLRVCKASFTPEYSGLRRKGPQGNAEYFFVVRAERVRKLRVELGAQGPRNLDRLFVL